MLRRTAFLALFTLLSPLMGRANEWEEDYSDEVRDESPPADDYPVSVDMGVSGTVSIDSFQGALEPYGDWEVVGTYGRVWRPHVAAGWRPYYYGRWEWTNEGWLWVSDEPFGWAAYHYGRWTFDPYRGWLWVPGNQWAPAWVSWRYSDDVVGWAPLAPGVSVYVSATPFLDAWWTFVPCRSFVAVPVYTAAYAPGYTRRYFQASVPAPARPGLRSQPGRPVVSPAWGGPPPRAIEERIGHPITPVRVVAAQSPGQGLSGAGEVSIYRPELRGTSVGGNPPRRSGFPSGSPGVPSAVPRPAAPERFDARPLERAWGGQPGATFRERPIPPPGGSSGPAQEPEFRGGGRGHEEGRPPSRGGAGPRGRVQVNAGARGFGARPRGAARANRGPGR